MSPLYPRHRADRHLVPSSHLILCDIVAPKAPKGAEHAICLKADLCDATEVGKLFQTEFGVPDTV